MYNVVKYYATSSFNRLYKIYLGGLLPEVVLEILVFKPIQ